MNRDTINSVLAGALVISLLASLLFCGLWVTKTRELRQLALDVNNLQTTRARMQGLVNVSMEYAKTNSSLDSILEMVGANPKQLRAAAKATPSK